MIFQSLTAPSPKNLAKNEEKPSSTCIKPIFWMILGVVPEKSTSGTRSLTSDFKNEIWNAAVLDSQK